MPIEIGAKIRQLRVMRSMTQEQLGSELGVSAQAVSKWESAVNMPDIQLLPQLSVLLGVSIDELFSVTDDTRMDRIENMIEAVRFIPEGEFEDAERLLKQLMQQEESRPRAMLLLGSLYSKRAKEYRDIAAPLAREALRLNPDEKAAHSVIVEVEGIPYADWNVSNHRNVIDFDKEFIKEHPENPRTYLWIMDLLILDGRTEEAKEYLAAMERIEHTYRTDLYAGMIAKEECDLPRALGHWEHMVEEFPDFWLSWFSYGDCLVRLCRYEEAVACYRKSMELQPPPRYIDNPDAISQIAEICGDYQTAIEMREKCIEICQTDWDLTEGEEVDCHKRELARLWKKMR